MDKQLALDLIQPLTEGARVCADCTLDSITLQSDRIDHRKDAVYLRFSTGIALKITLGTKGKAAFKTEHFSVSIDQTGNLMSEIDREVVKAVQARMVENDKTPPTHWVNRITASQADEGCDADLWLIPGHIGNPLDLSIRSLRVLKEVDVVFVEDGSATAVERIYEQFELGKRPRVIEIKDQHKGLAATIDETRNNGETMALFGATEGVPGLCDPGWIVLEAALKLDPTPTIKSISGGSALTTALMYTHTPGDAFRFMGLFENEDGSSAMLGALNRTVGAGRNASLISFANGAMLQDRWKRMRRATRHLAGSLSFIANATRPNEYNLTFRFEHLPKELPDPIQPDDKVVVRADFDPNANPIGWLVRLFRMPFALWG